MWRPDMEVPDELKFQRSQFDRRYSRGLGEAGNRALASDTIRALYGRGEITALIDRIMEHARARLEEVR